MFAQASGSCSNHQWCRCRPADQDCEKSVSRVANPAHILDGRKRSIERCSFARSKEARAVVIDSFVCYSAGDTLSIHLRTIIPLVLFQAAFHIMKPATFSEQLKVIGFNDSTSAIIADLWAVHAKHIIETKRKESVVPLKVNRSEASLNIYSIE